jgi:hypothetical protein
LHGRSPRIRPVLKIMRSTMYHVNYVNYASIQCRHEYQHQRFIGRHSNARLP